MNAGREENAARETMAASAEAGMILMDLSLEPLAIDQGATSILAARSRDRRCEDTVDSDPSLAVQGEVRDLMRHAEPAGPASLKVSFLVGGCAYSGRTYLVEPHGARPSLIVLYLKRDISECDRLAQVSSRYRLTDRERETLRGIALGLTNKELAQRMNIAPNTVKTFLRLVMVKMGVSRRTGIVAKLLEDIDVKRITYLLQIVLCLSFLCNGQAQTPSVSASCAQPLCVNRLDDSSTDPLPGMLRFAVRNAPAGGLITFDPRLSQRTIMLDASSQNNHIRIDHDVTIQGPGPNLLTVSGGSATRIFFIEGCNARIGGLTLADGLGKGGDGAPGTGGGGGGGGAAGLGGAVFLNSGSLMLSGVVLSANRAVGGNGGNGGSTLGPGEGGGGGGFGGNGKAGLEGAGAMGDLRGSGANRAGSGGAGGDSVIAGVGGGDAGFGGGGGGGGFSIDSSGRIGGSGGGNGFGGGAGGAAGFLDADGATLASSGGVGGAALGGAIFVRSGFLQLIDTSLIANSTSGGLSAAGSTKGPAKGGALFLCAAELCGAGSDAVAVWSGVSSFRGNAADTNAGEGCFGRGDTDVCGRLASLQVTHFGVVARDSTPSGVPFSIVVTALDADNIPVFTYAGTVHFASSDESSILPSDARLSVGAGAFSITLNTPGAQTITVTDTASNAMVGRSNAIEVIRDGADPPFRPLAEMIDAPIRPLGTHQGGSGSTRQRCAAP